MADYIDLTLPAIELALGDPSLLSLDVTLPSIEILELKDELPGTQAIGIHLPELTVSLTGLSPSVASIQAILGWPDLNRWSVQIYGGGEINIVLPSPTVQVNSLSGNLIAIAGFLPVSYGSLGTTHDNLGQINIKLPGLEGDVNVLSEIIGHIAGALPAFSYHGHATTGNLGSISAELPLIYYDSVLLSSGLIQLDVTLPCVLFDSTGSMSDATISYRTIVMNAENFGVTEYGDLTLKGMVDVFGKTIALNHNQLIQIGHTLDNTEHINASFRTGTLDFSNPYWMKPRDFWIQLRSGKKIKMTIKDNEVPANESSYLSENFVENLQKTRVKVGRGFFSEFFDVKIENIDGELLDITNIHIYTDPVRGRQR